ncbi:hypothetical protein ABH897_003464 [Paenibacillus sp. RC73]|uniref:hypothetical protein n=1 Tax=Paenibacillus sp. RC73 TaxID=3156250 RepID=UPI003839770D
MATEAHIRLKIADAIASAEANPDFGGEEICRHAVDVVRFYFGVTCAYQHCGGFDSPGYSVGCYAIAYVTETGRLGIYDYQKEAV